MQLSALLRYKDYHITDLDIIYILYFAIGDALIFRAR